MHVLLFVSPLVNCVPRLLKVRGHALAVGGVDLIVTLPGLLLGFLGLSVPAFPLGFGPRRTFTAKLGWVPTTPDHSV